MTDSSQSPQSPSSHSSYTLPTTSTPQHIRILLEQQSVENLSEFYNQSRELLTEEHRALDKVLKKEFSDDTMCVKRNYANGIKIYYKKYGEFARAHLSIVYYHSHKIHGGERDCEGDLIDTFPYYVNFYGDCDCKSFQLKCNTIDEVISVIKKRVKLEHPNVHTHDDFRISDELEIGIQTLLHALEEKEHLMKLFRYISD